MALLTVKRYRISPQATSISFLLPHALAYHSRMTRAGNLRPGGEMFNPADDVHGATMKRLGSRLTVAAAELRRAVENGYMGDCEGTLRIATRLEQIAFRILADNESGDSAAA